LNPLKRLYRAEEKKSYDIYILGRKAIYVFTGRLSRLHNGILPTYLVWCLIGMTVIFLGFLIVGQVWNLPLR